MTACFELGAIVGETVKAHIMQRRGINVATRFDESLAHANGIREGIGLVCDGRKNEVSERVIVEIVKAMAKRTCEYALVVGRHRADALADIARRYHATTFTQDARRATIIDHGDDRGDLQPMSSSVRMEAGAPVPPPMTTAFVRFMGPPS